MTTARRGLRSGLLAAAVVAGCTVAPVPGRSGPGGGGRREAAARALRVHRVVADDTLGRIARRYRVPGGVGALARLNGLSDPDVIRHGAGILVPDLGAATAALPEYRPVERFAGTLRPCATAPWPEPVDSPDTGCDERRCSIRSDGAKLCLCRAPDDAPGAGFWLSRPGRGIARWPARVWSVAPWWFEAADVDLDGDGARETVVASLAGASNGFTIETWNLAIADGARDGALLLTVHDFGRASLQERAGAGCDVLATEWAWLSDPLRVDGLYLTGRRWRYRAGVLEPGGEPAIARRLEGWAERPRATSPWGGELFDVGAMLVHPRTEIRPDEPGPPGEAAAERTGVVQAVHVEPHEFLVFAPRFRVLWDAGGESDVDHLSRVRLGADESLAYGRSGDERSGVFHPDGYVPADPVGAWVARRVRLAEYRPPLGGVERVLWIGESATSEGD